MKFQYHVYPIVKLRKREDLKNRPIIFNCAKRNVLQALKQRLIKYDRLIIRIVHPSWTQFYFYFVIIKSN